MLRAVALVALIACALCQPSPPILAYLQDPHTAQLPALTVGNCSVIATSSSIFGGYPLIGNMTGFNMTVPWQPRALVALTTNTFAAIYTNNIVAYNAWTGATVWSYATNYTGSFYYSYYSMVSNFQVVNGSLIIGTYANTSVANINASLMALNVNTGAVVWQQWGANTSNYYVQHFYYFYVDTVGGNVYATPQKANGNYVVLSITTGGMLNYVGTQSFSSTPTSSTIASGALWVLQSGGYMQAFNLTDGSYASQSNSNSWSGSNQFSFSCGTTSFAPVAINGTLYVFCSSVVYTFNTATGNTAFSSVSIGYYSYALSWNAAQQLFYVGDGDGDIYVVTPVSGSTGPTATQWFNNPNCCPDAVGFLWVGTNLIFSTSSDTYMLNSTAGILWRLSSNYDPVGVPSYLPVNGGTIVAASNSYSSGLYYAPCVLALAATGSSWTFNTYSYVYMATTSNNSWIQATDTYGYTYGVNAMTGTGWQSASYISGSTGYTQNQINLGGNTFVLSTTPAVRAYNQTTGAYTGYSMSSNYWLYPSTTDGWYVVVTTNPIGSGQVDVFTRNGTHAAQITDTYLTGPAIGGGNGMVLIHDTLNVYGYSAQPTAPLTKYKWKMGYVAAPGAIPPLYNILTTATVFGQVYAVPTTNGNIYAYQATSGASRWTFKSGNWFTIRWVQSFYELIYASNNNGTVYGINPSTGALVFTIYVPGGNFTSQPFITPEGILVCEMGGASGTLGSFAVAYNATAKVPYQLWNFTLNSGWLVNYFMNPPSYNRGVLFFPTTNNIVAVNAYTGVQLFYLPTTITYWAPSTYFNNWTNTSTIVYTGGSSNLYGTSFTAQFVPASMLLPALPQGNAAPGGPGGGPAPAKKLWIIAVVVGIVIIVVVVIAIKSKAGGGKSGDDYVAMQGNTRV